MISPTNIQIIGEEIAVAWSDGLETYVPFEKLRAASPSASNMGEKDIFGHQYGGGGTKSFPGIKVLAWQLVGNYAVCFHFSDGHSSGLYTYEYLRTLG